MQKPFNAEGLDLTFLFDATYPDPSISEVNNVAAASAMSGFTPEQTSSLQRMISTSIGEALEPLLESLGEFLSAWKKGPQSLSINASSTHGTSSELGFETQSSSLDGSHDQLSPNDFVNPSALEPRIPAKRKASAVDEAADFLVKKNCTFGLVGKETLSKPGVKGYSPEVQVKEEPTPETLLSEVQPSSTEDHASMFLSPAPTQSDMQTASSQGKAMEESSVKPESVEGQQHLANTDAEGLQSSDQSEAWLVFATSSATLKALFKDEPRMDKPCPTRDYFAEKPASLSKASNVYERSVPRLPFGAPLGCAHIIDVANTQNKSNPPIKMADIIATFLFKYSPDLLYAFLNVIRHPEFTFTRIETAGRGRRDFSIERSGLTVTVSRSCPLLKKGLADCVR